MADVLIRPTEPGDVEALYANLRASDRAECQAYGQGSILEGIRASAARSVLCWTGFVDDQLAAIIGCAPVSLVSGIGSPWMLGTPVLNANSRVLVDLTPSYIATMLTAFPHLVNYVHAKNTTSVRWLRGLGFTLHKPEPYGALGEPFRKFEMKA